MNKREFIKSSVLTVGALALAGPVAVLQIACGPNLQVQFSIARQILGAISTTLDQLNLPGPVALVAKAVAVLASVEKAYKAGKFADALTFLNEMVTPGGLFDQILADVNVASNKTIKGFMIALNGALRVIVIILESQQNQPAVAGALATASPADAAKIENVRKLADERTLDFALTALKF